MTDKPAIAYLPAIANLLARGRIDYETPTGWRAADRGLRDEVIQAVLKVRPADTMHAALLKRQPIRFRDDEKNITVRWSPG
jgi:hypothetical protein